MLQGWLATGLGPVVAVEPNPSPRLKTLKHVRFVDAIERIPRGKICACVVALKPQISATEAARLRDVAERGTPMISHCRFLHSSIATLKKAWGPKAHILRAMPNTPGAVARGITAIFKGPNATASDRALSSPNVCSRRWVRRSGSNAKSSSM